MEAETQTRPVCELLTDIHVIGIMFMHLQLQKAGKNMTEYF